MLFNSLEFIFLFLPVSIVVFFIIGKQQHHRVAISWLVFCSLFFYSWWNPAYLLLLIFSMLFNYSMGMALSSRNKSKPLLTIGIVANLGGLAYFKYTNFFIDSLNSAFELGYNVEHIMLPLAISFFTFQQVAYLVDAYRDEVREYNFLHYSLFVTFFPQLIAGPIVHHKEMLPQFSKNKTYSADVSNISLGITIFIIGLFKKVVLADSVADYSSPVFNAADIGQTISFFEAWGGALAYTLQLYFDFSGYADMAIGIAIMFGISLPLNFSSPYKSKNIIEFWRKWHMTLSRFLKDYLYIPLGGNRKGSKHLNLFATMALGGLWHGAALNFIIWGALHGIYLIINNYWRSFRQIVLKHDLEKSSFIGIAVSVFLTFLVVTVSWVFFRAETLAGAMNIITGMAGLNGFILPEKFSGSMPEAVSSFIIFEAGKGIGSFPSTSGASWIILLLIVVFFFPNTQQITSKYKNKIEKQCPKENILPSRLTFFAALISAFAFFISIKIMLSVSDSEFLYFNF